MSLFIHIFCQDAGPLLPKEISEFIEEGGYFDTPPKVSLTPGSAKTDDPQWTEMKLEYKARKRPVILHHETRPEEFKEEVAEALEELEGAGLEKHKKLVSHLKATRQLIVFELDSEKATEECWEMVDNLESWIARERNGLIYVSGEGFYDAELETLCKL